uniref:Uncharacterized protein n=1 Tax=Anguilla anguilla TaxID=7936 RepID=A0A0E9UKA5_ANGAN
MSRYITLESRQSASEP